MQAEWVIWDKARIRDMIARGSANPTIAIATSEDLKTMFEDSPQGVVELEEYIDFMVDKCVVRALRGYSTKEKGPRTPAMPRRMLGLCNFFVTFDNVGCIMQTCN